MDTPLPAPPATKPDPAAEFEAELIAWLENPDDFAVRELLAEGWPAYYIEDDTPDGLVVKEHPGGRKQWVRGAGANERVIRDL
jgi:hypothetical protein